MAKFELTGFFDALAERWDAMMSPDRDTHLARLLAPHAELFAGAARVLDIGTGTGAFLPHLARMTGGAQIVALDLSPEMLRRAQDSGRASGVCCFIRADAERLPFPPRTFDLVTCHDSFAHLEDRLEALRGFARVLRPGGGLLVLHDISRERLNTIHTQAANPRIHTHTLPPVAEAAAHVTAAGFAVHASADADDHYLIAARLAGAHPRR